MPSRKKKEKKVSRPSLFDYLDQAEKESKTNKYCNKSDLRNEASVEQFFVSKLLKDLGYEDKEIKPKESLSEILVARGRKKENYKPDYAIVVSGKPLWLVDAKSIDEKVDDWTYQGAGYALGLNREFAKENPCQYYVITNGLTFKVFKWDEGAPVITLTFPDFVEDNPNFLALRSLLGAKTTRRGWTTSKIAKVDSVILTKPSVEDVKHIFNSCHRLIWQSEK
jgi:type I restriction enzyme M protein